MKEKADNRNVLFKKNVSCYSSSSLICTVFNKILFWFYIMVFSMAFQQDKILPIPEFISYPAMNKNVTTCVGEIIRILIITKDNTTT